jgi:hypothetical protein
MHELRIINVYYKEAVPSQWSPAVSLFMNTSLFLHFTDTPYAKSCLFYNFAAHFSVSRLVDHFTPYEGHLAHDIAQTAYHSSTRQTNWELHVEFSMWHRR